MDYASGEILITVAHPSEEEVVRQAVAATQQSCEIIVTGVGGAAMSWALQKRFALGPPPSLVLGAGIAGSYVTSITPGNVVIAGTECFADMGVDDNGEFLSLFRANLADPDKPPFSGGRIPCRGRWFDAVAAMLPVVTGATVNMSSGSQAVIERIRKCWNPDIETMEGAWLAYTCALSGIEWLSVRAVSNMVEPRNLKNWDIPLALKQLQAAMAQILDLIKRQ